MITDKTHGFTLIEVLMAMTLLSLMVVLLFASLSMGAESWEAGEYKLAQVNQQAAVYQFFKRHLATIRPLQRTVENDGVPGQNSDSLFTFQGGHNKLTFVSALPASSARKGLQTFRIGRQNTTLDVVLTPFFALGAEQRWQKDQAVLLEQVEQFELFYLGRDETDEAPPQWKDSWLEQEVLPELIKIKISLTDGSVWPDMIFPLKITAAAVDEFTVTDDGEPESDDGGSNDLNQEPQL